MPFTLAHWTRLPLTNSAVYLAPAAPAWFVPTAAGDALLSSLSQGGTPDSAADELFLQRLPDGSPSAYCGRGPLIPHTPPLQELWFHITNACNLRCGHCLFSSGPEQAEQLSLTQLLQHAEHAYHELGCRLFALTGGEPLVHPDFSAMVEGLLAYPATRLVLLSNGLLAQSRLNDAWPRERIQLQISLDGRPERHDALRGNGSFARLQQQLQFLKENGWRFTLSMCPTRENRGDIPWLVEFAAEVGATAVHYMWHFIRGRATDQQAVEPETLLQPLLQADQLSRRLNIPIDNIEALKKRLFAPPRTIHDGSSAGVEGAAVGPDNRLYPTAATVGVAKLATTLDDGLVAAWQQSPVLQDIRTTSSASLSSPWRFLHGGGDFDHSFFHGGVYQGSDPYQPLLEALSLALIEQVATRLPEPPGAALRLKMGEFLEQCGSHGPVVFCKSNCLQEATPDSRSSVKEYYVEAAGDRRSEILNPVRYEDPLLSHIPAEFRFRGYGCGSPVMDAELQPGERVVDLGSGTGVECFIAARQVGAGGQVTGIDMLDPMLELANRGAAAVRHNLGYDNLSFVKGYLEELPLADNSADVLISNCVLNLSPDKRRTFAEISRVLAPGGRLVTADVVCEHEPPASILTDEELRGECIAGAMTQKDLVGILAESGLTRFRIIRRMPYRTVQGHPFFSLTFVVEKPLTVAKTEELVTVLYPGPAKALQLSNNRWLTAGHTARIPAAEAALFQSQLWAIDQYGFVENVAMSAGSCCSMPPEAAPKPAAANTPVHDSGCLVCGGALTYTTSPVERLCVYCNSLVATHATCENGHFVCDLCHIGDSLERLEKLCVNSASVDPMVLFSQVRNHPSFPLHGPQYHALVPGVLLASMRNAGYPVSDDQIITGIRRGAEVPGGSCGFMGVCGAASGIGIAFSVLFEATPLKSAERQLVQQVVQQVLAEIAGYEAARCCQRDCWLALRRGLELANELLASPMPTLAPYVCRQSAKNAECPGASCPLHPDFKRQQAIPPLQLHRTGQTYILRQGNRP